MDPQELLNFNAKLNNFLIRDKVIPWIFLPLKIGPFQVSIQGSEFHHSSPRETFENAKYNAFEVSLLENGKKVHPGSDDRFKMQSWALHFGKDDFVAYNLGRSKVLCMLKDLESYS